MIMAQTTRQTEVPELVLKNPRGYIQISQDDSLIAIEETHGDQATNVQLKSLAQENMQMPSILRFMTHRNNVFQAVQGYRQLLYADGTPVNDAVKKDLWYLLSRNCWIRLNGKFVTDEQDTQGVFWYLETDLRVTPEGFLVGKRKPLDTATIHENCYMTLELNSQGLPIKRSPEKSYDPNKNIYFQSPRDDAIPRFCATSNRANLLCGWADCDISPSLRVFASVNGASNIVSILRGGK